MKRGNHKLVIFIVAAVLMFLMHTLLYSEEDESKNFSHPIIPNTPEGKSERVKPFKSGEHSFSDKFLPKSYTNLFTVHNVPKREHNPYKIREFSPDPRIHYYIAEMRVREDIDYKIRKLGR